MERLGVAMLGLGLVACAVSAPSVTEAPYEAETRAAAGFVRRCRHGDSDACALLATACQRNEPLTPRWNNVSEECYEAGRFYAVTDAKRSLPLLERACELPSQNSSQRFSCELLRDVREDGAALAAYARERRETWDKHGGGESDEGRSSDGRDATRGDGAHTAEGGAMNPDREAACSFAKMQAQPRVSCARGSVRNVRRNPCSCQQLGSSSHSNYDCTVKIDFDCE